MILTDFSGTVISSLFAQTSMDPNLQINDDLVRHIVLNGILSYKKKFSEEFGELVICADSTNIWRKKYFKYYKINRKRVRNKSKYDWSHIFNILNQIKKELKENFPYKVIEVESAEADDVIATICKRSQTKDIQENALGFQKLEPILIISSDKDLIQLQKYKNVSQYSTLKKTFLKESNPKMFLKEHILRGDEGDGVPNFLSSDDTFVVAGTRQKPIRTDKLDVWMKQEPAEFCDERMLRNFKRNELLINLDCIPEDLEKKIIETYEMVETPGRKNLYRYFLSNSGLKKLTEEINNF